MTCHLPVTFWTAGHYDFLDLLEQTQQIDGKDASEIFEDDLLKILIRRYNGVPEYNADNLPDEFTEYPGFDEDPWPDMGRWSDSRIKLRKANLEARVEELLKLIKRLQEHINRLNTSTSAIDKDVAGLLKINLDSAIRELRRVKAAWLNGLIECMDRAREAGNDDDYSRLQEKAEKIEIYNP